jgi:hypothetical protein
LRPLLPTGHARAGVFTADTVPEEKVKELQAVEVDVDA